MQKHKYVENTLRQTEVSLEFYFKQMHWVIKSLFTLWNNDVITETLWKNAIKLKWLISKYFILHFVHIFATNMSNQIITSLLDMLFLAKRKRVATTTYTLIHLDTQISYTNVLNESMKWFCYQINNIDTILRHDSCCH